MEMRVAPEQKALFERAAAIVGLPLSGFAVSALLEASRKVVSEHEVTRLTPGDWSRFLAILDEDDVAPELRRAVEWVESGES
jgi:uncharacterized protein (DUF1778 family)